MTRKPHPLLTAYRDLPGIFRFGLWLAAWCLVLLMLPTGARADSMVARQGGDSVTVWDSPCTLAAVLAQIDKLVPGGRDEFRHAEALFQGARYAACWRPTPMGAHIVYEDGDQGMVPRADFKPAPTI